MYSFGECLSTDWRWHVRSTRWFFRKLSLTFWVFCSLYPLSQPTTDKRPRWIYALEYLVKHESNLWLVKFLRRQNCSGVTPEYHLPYLCRLIDQLFFYSRSQVIPVLMFWCWSVTVENAAPEWTPFSVLLAVGNPRKYYEYLIVQLRKGMNWTPQYTNEVNTLNFCFHLRKQSMWTPECLTSTSVNY